MTLIRVLILVSIFSTTSLAQVSVRIHYNASWQITIERDASFIRNTEVVFQGDSLIWDGVFTDSTVDGRLVREGTYRNGEKHGHFKFYHDNTVLESSGEYVDGRRIGKWNYYNDHGGIKQVVIFSGEDFSVQEFYDTRNKRLVSEGSGNWRLSVPFGDKVVMLNAYFTNGKRSGKWVYRYSPGGKILTEEYGDEGSFLNGIDHEKKGNPTYAETKLKATLFEVPDLLRMERLEASEYFHGPDAVQYIRGIEPQEVDHPGLKPSYRDGIEEFYEYVLKNYRYPETAYRDRLEGQVIIDFLVDMDGSTSDFRVMRGISQELNAEAVRLISSTDGWVPAEYKDQSVQSRISVPITFKVK